MTMEYALCVLQVNSKVRVGQQHVWICQGMENHIATLVKGSAVPLRLIKMASLGLLQMMVYVLPVFQVNTHHSLSLAQFSSHAMFHLIALSLVLCSSRTRARHSLII